jgi:hypothetical protein
MPLLTRRQGFHSPTKQVKDRETAFAAASNRSAGEWRILGGEGYFGARLP